MEEQLTLAHFHNPVTMHTGWNVQGIVNILNIHLSSNLNVYFRMFVQL